MITPRDFWNYFSKSFSKIYDEKYSNQSFDQIYRYNRTYTPFIDDVFEDVFQKFRQHFADSLTTAIHTPEFAPFADQRRLDHLFQFMFPNDKQVVAIEHENSFTQNVRNEELPKLIELDQKKFSNLSVLIWSYNTEVNNINPLSKLEVIREFLRDYKLFGKWLVILGPGFFSARLYDEFLQKIREGICDFVAYEIYPDNSFEELEKKKIVGQILNR